MNPLSVGTVGIFVVIFTAVVVWSPLARGLVREAVTRPNEACTFTATSEGKVKVHRKMLPEDLQDRDKLTSPSHQGVGSSSLFKWVLGATFVITLLALITVVALVFAPPGEQTASASGTCEKAFIFGFSALIGLIGGKAIK